MAKKSSSQSDPYAPSKAARDANIGNAQATYTANQPGIQANADMLNQGFHNLAPMAFGNNPLQTQTEGALSDTIGGKYLGANPYMDGMMQTTNNNITNGVNSQFEQGGRYGSVGHAGILAQRIGEADNQLQYNNYNDERARQQQAIGMSGSVQDNRYAGVSPLLALAGGAATLPYSGLSAANNNINASSSGYGKNTGRQTGLGNVTDSYSTLINSFSGAAKAAAGAGG